MTEIKQIKVGSTTYDIRDDSKVPKTITTDLGSIIFDDGIENGEYPSITVTDFDGYETYISGGSVSTPTLYATNSEGYGVYISGETQSLELAADNMRVYTTDEQEFTLNIPRESGTLAVVTGTAIPELKVRNGANNNTGSVNTAQVKCSYITGADITSNPESSPTIAFAAGPATTSAPEIIYAPQGLGVIENWNDYEIVNKKYANEHYMQSANTTTLTVVNKNASLSYGATTTIAEVAGIPISVTMPSGSSGSGGSGTVSAPSVSSSDNTFRLIMTAVAGTATPSTSTIVSNKLYANAYSGQLTASAFHATSDQRLKENIKDYIPEKSILDLPVVEFDFKDSGLHTIGCLAQDLQNLFPELVDTNPDGYLSIAENKLVYLCLLEIKKLRSELDELKKQCN